MVCAGPGQLKGPGSAQLHSRLKLAPFNPFILLGAQHYETYL